MNQPNTSTISIRPEQRGSVPIHAALSNAESYHAINSDLQPQNCPLWTPRPVGAKSMRRGAFARPEPVVELNSFQQACAIGPGLIWCAWTLVREQGRRVSLVRTIDVYVVGFWAVVLWLIVR